MGRELRRKQAKREGKSLKSEIQAEEHQLKKLIIITIVLIVIIGLIYLLSALFITKELDWFENKPSSSTPLAENTILAAEIFKQQEEDYYVYFYDFDDEDEEIGSVITSLRDTTVYRVDTGSALNNKYVSELSNKNAKTLKDLKVKPSTVIKVSGDTIKAYYENDEITEKLGK